MDKDSILIKNEISADKVTHISFIKKIDKKNMCEFKIIEKKNITTKIIDMACSLFD
jgi:hypothetical protein